MPYILNETRALEKKLSGQVVQSSTSPDAGTKVPVMFVGPDTELFNASFPGIYLKYGDPMLVKADNREHRGRILLPYAPEGYPSNILVPEDMSNPDDPNEVPWLINEDSLGDPLASPYIVPDVPVPFDLHFDIAVLTRNYQENMQLVGLFSTRPFLPARFGYLEVPEDGTVRTLELLGGPDTGYRTDTDDKRIIQTNYSIRVATELSLYDIIEITRVTGVNIEFTPYDPPPQSGS